MAVVGVGYTGLPLAVGFAAAGLTVVCLDSDVEKIAAIAEGRSYLPDVSDAELSAHAEKLMPATDPEALTSVEAVVICVPTPLTGAGEPDLAAVFAVTETVGPRLRRGSVVVLQSTVPPGTTADLAKRLAELSGLCAGVDFHLAHAPERIDPANKAGWTLANTPKLVGGLTPACTVAGAELFGLVTERVIPVSRLEVAEAAKVFENTFRMVNIALTYELADLCRELGVPVNDVIDAAATKPYGFLAHRPGPGVGGECIAVDPMFLRSVAEGTGVGLPMITQAYQRIRTRPETAAKRLADLLRARGTDLAGSQVLVVGAAYKPGVGDTRNAPAIDLIRVLRAGHAKVSYTDPMVPNLVVDGEAVPRVEWDRESVSAFDCLVLMTPHEQIMSRPLWYAAPMLLDCWSVLTAGDGVVHL
ncbi:nucleotide sugar dehydrogenase [Streptomyces nigrescens]|uniref:nucleotide sugar dehydrogenase n=2 Tax=Streptomyces TaxID=1883 RepID=UPI0036F72D84